MKNMKLKRLRLIFILAAILSPLFASASDFYPSFTPPSFAEAASVGAYKRDLVQQTAYGEVQGTKEENALVWKGLPYAKLPAAKLAVNTDIVVIPLQIRLGLLGFNNLPAARRSTLQTLAGGSARGWTNISEHQASGRNKEGKL
jgi:hypothetical protein